MLLDEFGNLITIKPTIFWIDTGRLDHPRLAVKTYGLNEEQFDQIWKEWFQKWNRIYPSYGCPNEAMKEPHSSIIHTFQNFAMDYIKNLD